MGVTLRRWAEPFPGAAAADVVVDAFGGGLPEPYVEAMARAPIPPAWFVLEYLSAEAWVEGTHGLGSPHPQRSLPRRFWFPGFTAKTGGLLRERGLLASRDAFRRDDSAQRSVVGCARRSPARAGRDPSVALLLSESGVAGAPRRVGRGRRRPCVCVVPEGSCDRRARRVDRGQRSASASSVPSGSIDAPCHSVRGAGHVRPAALGFVAQLRARRGFVRSRAVGGAPLRLEHLSPAAGGALAEARRVPRALDRRTRIGAGGGAAPLLARLERRAGCDRRGVAGLRAGAPCARPARRGLGGRSWPNCPTWRRDWSRQPCIWYN